MSELRVPQDKQKEITYAFVNNAEEIMGKISAVLKEYGIDATATEVRFSSADRAKAEGFNCKWECWEVENPNGSVTHACGLKCEF